MRPKKAVIIGSGLGGLGVGVMLARQGYQVTLLEKNRQPGGALQIFSRDKAIIDTGVHYLGSMGHDELIGTYFRYWGIGEKLKPEKLDEACFDLVSIPSGDFPFAQGFDRFAQTLAEYFPHEKDNLVRYVRALKEITGHFPVCRMEPGLVNPAENKWLQISAKSWIESLVTDPLLRHVLAGNHMLYEGRPESTPAYVHAMTTASYIQSAWRLPSGGGQIARFLVDELKKCGGEFLNYKEVISLKGKNGLLQTAQTADGDTFEADIFVGGIHPVLLYDMLEDGLVRSSYKNRLKALPNSLGTFTTHCILKPGMVPYQNHNLYGYVTDDVWQAASYTQKNWPLSFSAFYSKKSDETHAECINLMTLMRFDEVDKWGGTFRTYPHFSDSRGEDYEIWKQNKMTRILDLAEEKIPGLKEGIQAVYASTPLSYRDYLGSPNGSMYGILKDVRNPYASIFSPRTKVSNLFLTGQNLNLHGIAGVTISAVVTAGEIIGHERLMADVRKEMGLPVFC
jgi:all-trans-retinol 13,14-reductase